MAHVREKTWPDVREQLSGLSNSMLDLLNRIKDMSAALTLMYVQAGGTDEALAAQLFREEIASRNMQRPAEDPPIYTPTPLEVQMTADARVVAVALQEIWKAANNEPVATADRVAAIYVIS